MVAVFFTLQAPVWRGLFICAFYLPMAWEWAKLSGLESNLQAALYGFVSLILVIVGLSQDLLQPAILVMGGLAWILIGLCLWAYPKGKELFWGSCPVRLVWGLVVLLSAGTALFWIWALPQGPWVLFYLFSVVWTADICAYLIGYAFGRHRMTPVISPGKTIEGALGGLSASLAIAALVGWLVPMEIANWPIFLCLSLGLGLASILGDLLESMLKREAKVKDSGTVFPGHGGFLDRLDSLCAAAPVLALAVLLLQPALWTPAP